MGRCPTSPPTGLPGTELGYEASHLDRGRAPSQRIAQPATSRLRMVAAFARMRASYRRPAFLRMRLLNYHETVFLSNSLNPDRYRRRVRRQSVLGNRCLLFVRGLASTVCLGLGVARLRPTEQDSLVILRRGRRDP